MSQAKSRIKNRGGVWSTARNPHRTEYFLLIIAIARAERSQVKLVTPQIVRLGHIWRAAQKHRELLDLQDVIALRMRAEAADGHVFDHPLAQRADGLLGHGTLQGSGKRP